LSEPPIKPVLVFGYGNPSRGDDALGPALIERLEPETRPGRPLAHVELLTDFQLQVEHALDLVGRRQVVFVDADMTTNPPFRYQRIAPERDTACTTHAMSPQTILHVHAGLHDPASAPECWLMGIRACTCELGQGISEQAAANLDAACRFLSRELAQGQA